MSAARGVERDAQRSRAYLEVRQAINSVMSPIETMGRYTYKEFQALRYFPVLDGLRAASVLLVVTWHVRADSFFPLLGGDRGVNVFFIISGFLISTLLLRERADRGRIDYVGFYVRRVFRILPLYYVALAIYCVLILGLGVQSDRAPVFVRSLPYYMFYFQEYPHFSGWRPPFGVAWSLGIEEKFYFAWPFVIGATTIVLAGRVGAAMLTGALAFCLAPAVVPWGEFLHPYGFILLGCGVAVLLDRRESFDRLRFLASGRWLYLTIALTVMIQVASIWRREYVSDTLFGVAFTLVFVGLVLRRSGFMYGVLVNPVLARIGTLSYSVYLFHQIALNSLELLVPKEWGLAGSFLILVAGLGITLVVAEILHRTVEKPLIEFGRSMLRRRRNTRASAATAEQTIVELPAP
jgi:peptidoglycan/LPS O-acetylase OafA/YrhL